MKALIFSANMLLSFHEQIEVDQWQIHPFTAKLLMQRTLGWDTENCLGFYMGVVLVELGDIFFL